MTDINPEEYRKQLETIYAESSVRKRDFGWGEKRDSISFDELKVLKDGKKEFIVGIRCEREDVPDRRGECGQFTGAHSVSKSTVFGMLLEKGQLSGEPLRIDAVSNSAHEYCYYDRGWLNSNNERAKTEVNMTIGRLQSPVFSYRKVCGGNYDVADLAQVSAAIVSGEVDHRASSLNKESGDRKSAIALCDRFLEPRGEASRLLKAEEERKKRVERFSKLRKMVEKKREKLAEKQKKQEEKRRQKEEKAKARHIAAMQDNFLK